MISLSSSLCATVSIFTLPGGGRSFWMNPWLSRPSSQRRHEKSLQAADNAFWRPIGLNGLRRKILSKSGLTGNVGAEET
jgi:hypothetical protein